MSAKPGQVAPIINTDASNFQTEVLDASHHTAILVDFWAEWCAPCKALAPVLEKVVNASNGAVRLAKIDIDSNQEFAGKNGIRSIPTVRLFVDGSAVAEFMGAQSEQAIQAFLEQHLPRTASPETPPSAGPEHVIASMLRENQFEQAAQTLQQLSADERDTPAMQCLAARVALATQAAGQPDIDELRARVIENPADLDTRLALSTIQAARGDYDNAMEGLLLILSRDRNFADGAARKNILTIFDALGAGDERVNQFRGMLANVLL
jgi:putative thioredoxin